MFSTGNCINKFFRREFDTLLYVNLFSEILLHFDLIFLSKIAYYNIFFIIVCVFFLFFIIDLSRNRFCELPEDVTTFPFLETLLMYHNTLRTLPETVRGLHSLSFLDLR